MRHIYIIEDVPNIHTHISAVHSVSNAVSLFFASEAHIYIIEDVPNIHTHISAVDSVLNAVSLFYCK